MKYLLDTHILIWWLTNPEKLRTEAISAIKSYDHLIYVSSASIWEMAVKESLGKLVVPKNILNLIESQNLKVLPVYPEEALNLPSLPEIHKDPFDRMLISQAKLYDLTLITRDKLIIKYPIKFMVG